MFAIAHLHGLSHLPTLPKVSVTDYPDNLDTLSGYYYLHFLTLIEVSFSREKVARQLSNLFMKKSIQNGIREM